MYIIPSTRTRMQAKSLCRELRRIQTEAEDAFWQAVRNRQILGFKFYRQHPIFFEYYKQERFFIADFCCVERRLVIEIDGKIHNDQQDYDALRTHLINIMGIHVMRFRNEDILKNLDEVIQALSARLV